MMADKNQAYVKVRMWTILRIPGVVNIWMQTAGKHWWFYVYTPRRAREWKLR